MELLGKCRGLGWLIFRGDDEECHKFSHFHSSFFFGALSRTYTNICSHFFLLIERTTDEISISASARGDIKKMFATKNLIARGWWLLGGIERWKIFFSIKNIIFCQYCIQHDTDEIHLTALLFDHHKLSAWGWAEKKAHENRRQKKFFTHLKRSKNKS